MFDLHPGRCTVIPPVLRSVCVVIPRRVRSDPGLPIPPWRRLVTVRPAGQCPGVLSCPGLITAIHGGTPIRCDPCRRRPPTRGGLPVVTSPIQEARAGDRITSFVPCRNRSLIGPTRCRAVMAPCQAVMVLHGWYRPTTGHCPYPASAPRSGTLRGPIRHDKCRIGLSAGASCWRGAAPPSGYQGRPTRVVGLFVRVSELNARVRV